MTFAVRRASRRLGASRKRFFAEGLPAGNHEDHVLRHQARHRCKVPRLAGGKLPIDQLANGTFVINRRRSDSCQTVLKRMGVPVRDPPSPRLRRTRGRTVELYPTSPGSSPGFGATRTHEPQPALQRKRAGPVFVTGSKPRESLSAPVAEI